MKDYVTNRFYGVTGYTVIPEYKPMATADKAAITRKAENRFKDFIIGDELDISTEQRPPQMTDEEIVMSITRLADKFFTEVENLRKALNV